MLRAFLWLVSNVVSACRTIFNRPTRYWHTGRAEEAQLPLLNDFHKGADIGPPGSRPAIDAQRQTGTLHDHASTSGSVFKEHAFPAQAGIQSARTARSIYAHSLAVIPGEGAQRRRPGTQGPRARLSGHAPLASRFRGNEVRSRA